MTLSKLEKHLAGQAVENLDDINYFLRYFAFVHKEDRINAKDHDSRLYGVMVDLFKHEFPDYFGWMYRSVELYYLPKGYADYTG